MVSNSFQKKTPKNKHKKNTNTKKHQHKNTKTQKHKNLVDNFGNVSKSALHQESRTLAMHFFSASVHKFTNFLQGSKCEYEY